MSGTPGASADDVITSESDMDMDFEPGSEVDTEDLDNEDFIERLIERGELDYHIPGQFVEDGEDDEDEDEDEDDADTEDGSKYSRVNQLGNLYLTMLYRSTIY